MLDTLASQSALVAVIVCVASAVALLLRSTQGSTVRFAFFALSMGAFHASFLGSGVVGSRDAFVAFRVVMAAVAVLAADVFIAGILGDVSAGSRQQRRRTVLIVIGIVLVALTPGLEVKGVTAAIAVVLLLVVLVRLWRVLEVARRIESNAERTRLRTLAWAGVVATAFAGLDVLAFGGAPVPAVGGLVMALYVYFLSQAILSSRLLDLHELLGKVLVFGSLALILAVVYGFLFLWVGDRRGFFLSNTLVASSLILILFEPVKTRLEETATRVFFREQLTFSHGLRRLVSRLMTTIELPRAFAALISSSTSPAETERITPSILPSSNSTLSPGRRSANTWGRLQGTASASSVEPAVSRSRSPGRSSTSPEAGGRGATSSRPGPCSAGLSGCPRCASRWPALGTRGS